ncbi:hypothetical protein A2331_03975 [Candidatus Falkowbacteria bacterium RIFOXYB2_FULL_34_18]|uniref:PEP-utilising enzyme mobile domain-containing protein n=1 Tax=Candidatus Falkowbacteria bacterium RIFOXYD2_FULL_34_120 TaxID=1798007 RepID=A0A1F5TP75_9BACT|nr:MAG: hypothetical protein A2331_03975 [Candidatus Falkowbacteria bacterium RIFOXYB2_FULL_34_18]OGF29109.1 MAG: hypothetical protein A2500_03300 [Candidatus Falkowbacteria bacterium RIFOXYC12_FULL_34_55]OGF36192.1 MAG: hypothetical protein A2466_04830 [Candidatus Falkowbacteria bacterium RIFOXYC2_FULL_34_220]OGF38619.1 MAG: hypothetical protein A2515_02190 [Candidatus Falkowbacteria bacterium RIFOXYD12_FULL_34_57]OGF40802.1 MAG: hypothetical protein A2531_06835 [Candidatus Falkowbacteria bact
MIISGKVKIIRRQSDYYDITEEVIIVAKRTTPDIVVVMDKVLAIVTEVNSKLHHAAIISREYNKPLVMGVENATRKYKDGDIIFINIDKKIIC